MARRLDGLQASSVSYLSACRARLLNEVLKHIPLFIAFLSTPTQANIKVEVLELNRGGETRHHLDVTYVVSHKTMKEIGYTQRYVVFEVIFRTQDLDSALFLCLHYF